MTDLPVASGPAVAAAAGLSQNPGNDNPPRAKLPACRNSRRPYRVSGVVSRSMLFDRWICVLEGADSGGSIVSISADARQALNRAIEPRLFHSRAVCALLPLPELDRAIET